MADIVGPSTEFEHVAIMRDGDPSAGISFDKCTSVLRHLLFDRIEMSLVGRVGLTRERCSSQVLCARANAIERFHKSRRAFIIAQSREVWPDQGCC